MKVLALDTSTLCSVVSAYDSVRETVSSESSSVSVHSETLLLHIDSCLKKQGWQLSDLDGIVCGAGPGSFTGLRIGAATAKGLCFACNLPLLMVSSLHALAYPYLGSSFVLGCTQASQGKVYARLFLPMDGLGSTSKTVTSGVHAELYQEHVWQPQDLCRALESIESDVVVCGDGPKQCADLVTKRTWHQESTPLGISLAHIGVSRLRLGDVDPVDIAVPNYTLASAAEQARDSKKS